jgi:carbon storage regulator (csrA)
MLILTRRAGESLHIGNDIKITLLSIQGKQVRIGIEVPDGTAVLREEVYLRVKEENKQSLMVHDADLVAAAALWKTTKQN